MCVCVVSVSAPAGQHAFAREKKNPPAGVKKHTSRTASTQTHSYHAPLGAVAQQLAPVGVPHQDGGAADDHEERRDDGGLPGRDAEPHGGEEGGRGGEDEEEGAQEGLPVGAWAFRGGFPVKAEEEFRRG